MPGIVFDGSSRATAAITPAISGRLGHSPSTRIRLAVCSSRETSGQRASRTTAGFELASHTKSGTIGDTGSGFDIGEEALEEGDEDEHEDAPPRTPSHVSEPTTHAPLPWLVGTLEDEDEMEEEEEEEVRMVRSELAGGRSTHSSVRPRRTQRAQGRSSPQLFFWR